MEPTPPSDSQNLYFAAVSVSAIHNYVVQPHYIISFFIKQDEFFVFRRKKSAKNADFVFGLIICRFFRISAAFAPNASVFSMNGRYAFVHAVTYNSGGAIHTTG